MPPVGGLDWQKWCSVAGDHGAAAIPLKVLKFFLFQVMLWQFLLLAVSLHLPRASFPILPFCKIGHDGSGTHLLVSDLILIIYICGELFPHEVMLCGPWGEGFVGTFWFSP